MKFIAHLVTTRQMERGVTKIAADQVNAIGQAIDWLKHSGSPGDYFDVAECREVAVARVTLIAPDKIETVPYPASTPEIQK